MQSLTGISTIDIFGIKRGPMTVNHHVCPECGNDGPHILTGLVSFRGQPATGQVECGACRIEFDTPREEIVL